MIHIVAPPAPSAAYSAANINPMVAYENLMAEGTLVDALLPTGGPRIDATTEDTDEFWLTSGTNTTCRTTLVSPKAADVCFVANHTLGSRGATFTLQYRSGGVWNTLWSFAPENDDPFMVVFPNRTADGWGVQVSTDATQIGVLWIGPRVVIPGGITPDYQPIWARHRVEKLPGVTRRGHFKGQRIERVGGSMEAVFMPVPHDFALVTMRGFRKHYNEGKAFVFASSPSRFAEDFAYCWATEDAAFSPFILAGGGLAQFTITAETYVEP